MENNVITITTVQQARDIVGPKPIDTNLDYEYINMELASLEKKIVEEAGRGGRTTTAENDYHRYDSPKENENNYIMKFLRHNGYNVSLKSYGKMFVGWE